MPFLPGNLRNHLPEYDILKDYFDKGYSQKEMCSFLLLFMEEV